jgi:hypothetical protein
VIRAGDAGEMDAIDIAWRAWLARPDEKLWQALQRWDRITLDRERYSLSLLALGLPSTATDFREALIAAASRDGHPISHIARERILSEAGDQELVDAVCQAAAAAHAASRLGAWCADQGLVPADRVDRAAFFVLTGQAAQYRAEDPDGSLLTLAYQAGTDADREGLRAAIAHAGDLDLLRLAANAAASSPRPATAGEARYLAARLAARRDWHALWRLAQRLPLTQAVAAMPAFDDAFRPAGAAERELFMRLAGTAPEPIARARGALLASSVRPVPAGPHPRMGSVSPGGRELAVADRAAEYLSLIELPSLVLRKRQVLAHFPEGILHLGDGVLVWNGYSVIRYTQDSAENLYTGELLPSALGMRIRQAHHHPRGFVAALSEKAEGPDRLRFATASGQVIRDVPLADLGITGEVRLCAADPNTGRLALSSYSTQNRLWIVDGDPDRTLEVTGCAPLQAALAGGSFAGSDRLVTSGHGVEAWRLDRGSPELLAAKQFHAVNSIATLGYDMVAVTEPGTSAVTLLDTETLETLAEVTVPEKFEYFEHCELQAAPCGRFLAVQQRGAFSLIDGGAVALACRPLGIMTAQHWALATGLLEDPGTGEAAREFLVLLRDVLGTRLGGEVALGGVAARDHADADDIGLVSAVLTRQTDKEEST